MMKVHSTLLCRLQFLSLLCVIFFSCTDLEEMQLSSPDGKLTIAIDVDNPQNNLHYQVFRQTDRGNIQVLLPSPIGIKRADQDFNEGLSMKSLDKINTIDSYYTLLHGKRSNCHDLANHQILHMENKEGHKLDLEIRAYNDAVALRYVFPDSDTSEYRVVHESTGFRIPDEGLACMQPHADAYPSYEQYYQADIPVGTASPNKAGWSFPALFRIPDEEIWMMITEAGLDKSYCGTRLRQEAPGGLYSIRFPDEREGNCEGEVFPSSSLPWMTPWRVIMVGETVGDIVESSVVTHLNPPSKAGDTPWIKPGRASWSWWSDSPSTRDYDKLLPFIDLSARMGWEYSLVDAGWHFLGKEKIRNLVEYGRERSVGIILWYHSGGHPRMQEYDLMKDRKRRREEFRWLKETGVKGIKTDFFLSDKQHCIKQYIGILEDALEFNLMVNYHGCTLPRGWSRTYPNLMTMEAVKGEEFYKAHDHYPGNAPVQNTIWPYTRNVMGSMDYTPTAFSDNRYPHVTSYAHELALPVIYESGWVHFIDAVESYLKMPDAVQDFLGTVPAAWDDIRFISGYPGKYIVLARRNKEDWYIGGINGEQGVREIECDLSFLGEGEYNLLLFTDGENPRDMVQDVRSTGRTETLSISMHEYGGFAGRFTPK